MNENMLSIDPEQIATRDLHQFLLGCVAPRPIAFVSTLDEEGRPNLAPYSFFNAFSSNPPIVVFSSNRRVADNTTKDTLYNIQNTREAVINVVNYDIVRQMTVTSIQYPAEISEFDKAGLTPIPSEVVRPFRVQESPAHLECQVQDIITLGEHGGAGHLIICRVVRLHIAKHVVDERNRIDPHKIDLMGRMGRAHYVRASGDAIHTIVQPVLKIGVGYDALPESFRRSPILSANNLGQLAGLKALPTAAAAQALLDEDATVRELLGGENVHHKLHEYAKSLLDTGDQRERAAQVLLLADSQ
ncbi:MAG: flavin reductase family protein [Bacteroidota bacterium]